MKPGDTITVSYLDKENTNPGIPIERTYTVTEAGGGTPRVRRLPHEREDGPRRQPRGHTRGSSASPAATRRATLLTSRR